MTADTCDRCGESYPPDELYHPVVLGPVDGLQVEWCKTCIEEDWHGEEA